MPRLINADDDGFVIIGHRGASSYFPENTMPSFKGAVERGAEMLELDVQLSKDGVPVVFHDAKLQRTTNGEGWLSHRTLGEIKQLDAGSWFAKRFAGTRIPTLEEVLEFAKDRIALNIEIKTEAVTNTVEGGIEEKCLELVRQYGMGEHVIFSSFDYRAIEHLRQLDPDIPLALLYNPIMAGGKKPSELIAKFQADAFNCSKRELDAGWIKDLKANNIPVFVYTVNQRRMMKQLVKKGVNGIFTNKPDVLEKVVAKVLKKGSGKQVK